ADPAAAPVPGDLELPSPGRLALTAGWNLAESLGLPLLAYAAGDWLGGQGAGIAAATGVVGLTAALRKGITGSGPGLLGILGLVREVADALVVAAGSVLGFRLKFPLPILALWILLARTEATGRRLVARLVAEVVALRRPSDARRGLDRFFRGVTWLWAGIFAA